MVQAQTSGVREYELIYVLRPTVDNAEAEKVNGRVTQIVESFGGKLTKLDNWGRRRLAYPIQRHGRGLFVYAKYLGSGGVVAEVERTLRISDSVLRHQTVLLNSDVDPSLVDVDPEELKFAPVEDAEPEEEVGLEQRLGLSTESRSKGDSESSSSKDESKAEAKDESKAEAKDESKTEASASEGDAKESGSEEGGRK